MNKATANKYRNLAFWAWNGDMNDNDVISQINGFHEQGFGGFFIHARAGLTISYMGEAWMHACEIAIKTAEHLNLDVWLYDEDGWPSGFAGGKVNALGLDYHIKKLHIKEGQCPSIPSENIIARYQKVGNQLQYTTESGHIDVTIYYSSDAHYVDLLNPNVTDAFIKFTHEKYLSRFKPYFGSVIKGIFTDEPQVHGGGIAFSFEIEEAFNKFYCEDYRTQLHMLFNEDTVGDEYRQKYFQTINRLFKANYIQKLAQWCEHNKISFTGHFSAEDGLIDQSACNGGVMSMYPLMHVPGIDFLGRRLPSPILLKQVSSIKNQYQKPLIISETFGCSGWNTTFAQFSWLWGYQAAHGINLACLHLSAFSIKGIRKRDYPAFFSYQEPWFEEFHHLTKWMNELNAILSDGKKKVDVAVLNPISSVSSKKHLSNEQQIIASQYRILIESLITNQIEFDIIDENLFLEQGKVENGKVCLGYSSYSIWIVPYLPTLNQELLKYMTDFIEQSGKLVFINNTPGNIPKEPFLLNNTCVTLMNRTDIHRKYFEKIEFDRPIYFMNGKDYKPVDGIALTCIDRDTTELVYLLNKSTIESKHMVGVFHRKSSVKIINTSGDEIRTLKSQIYKNKTYFDLSIQPMESVLIQFEDEAQVEVQGLLQNRYQLKPIDVKLLNDNVYTIDRCRFAFNHETLSQSMPVIEAADAIYQKIDTLRKGAQVTIEYAFMITDNINNVKVNLEDEGAISILLNGQSIEMHNAGYFIDKAIHTYDIQSVIKKGINTLSVIYNVPYIEKSYKVDEVYETERNRFFYPVEIENVYITGDFDVNCINGSIHESTHYLLEDTEFELGNLTPKKGLMDLTPQGLWFYRGVVEYRFSYVSNSTLKSIQIEFENPNMTIAKVFINGADAGSIFLSPYQLDISQYIQPGLNHIIVRVYGSNRNCLGPHHHYKGEPNFVGVSTFKGIYGFEDFVNSDAKSKTWNEGYAFVPFGVKSIYILENYE